MIMTVVVVVVVVVAAAVAAAAVPFYKRNAVIRNKTAELCVTF